ncbi:MAG: ABC transporter substrate-binding protein [Spirochaetota bacterium]
MRLLHISGIVILTALSSAALLGCGGGEAGQAPAPETAEPEQHQASKELVIAEQYGLAYAPLQVMRAQGFLEAELPDYEIEWSRLGNTAAIREAILAGRLDVGFMGIPPFLIGYDRGMEWRIFTGLSQAPLGLVTWREDLQSLSDFGPQDKIALPQPGSIQHILLSMACQRQLGDAQALDDRLVTMNHPDGMNALLSRRDISAHFTSPPYLMEELAAEGTRLVVSGRQAMGGDFTFIVGVATQELMNSSPQAMAALRRALAQSIDFMQTERSQVLRLLAGEYGLTEEKVAEYLDWEGMKYSQRVLGLEGFIDFMAEQDYLNESFPPSAVLSECLARDADAAAAGESDDS